MTAIPRILGLGYSVPTKVRKNDDPIFDWIKRSNPAGADLFKGYDQRRVLDQGEDVLSIMVPAAQRALRDAGLAAGDIDLLIGFASEGAFTVPNDLSRVHLELGLPEHAWVLPIGSTFSNFNASLVLADTMIRAGRAKNVLIVVGGNWSRLVDYHTPQAVSAADGAGAAVIGLSCDPTRWQIADQFIITQSKNFGTMFMQPDPKGDAFTAPYFHITEAGITAFKVFGGQVTPTAATQLLQRNGLKGSDVALISHQASSVLLDAWEKVIQPAHYVKTLAQFANMTAANIPVTFAWATANDPITQDNVVLLGIGVEMHASALLLRRNVPDDATGPRYFPSPPIGGETMPFSEAVQLNVSGGANAAR